MVLLLQGTVDDRHVPFSASNTISYQRGRRMLEKICLMILVILAAGCATDYKTQSFRGGYSEVRLDENVFTVRFKGNAYTSPERAADFCLLRCAELALANGYSYFIITDSSHYTKRSTYTTPATAYTSGTANTFGTATAYGN